jgi:hypothetical protein
MRRPVLATAYLGAWIVNVVAFLVTGSLFSGMAAVGFGLLLTVTFRPRRS